MVYVYDRYLNSRRLNVYSIMWCNKGSLRKWDVDPPTAKLYHTKHMEQNDKLSSKLAKLRDTGIPYLFSILFLLFRTKRYPKMVQISHFRFEMRLIRDSIDWTVIIHSTGIPDFMWCHPINHLQIKNAPCDVRIPQGTADVELASNGQEVHARIYG